MQPGTHINAVGTDTKGKRELPEGLLTRARVVVDDRDQARQIGEGQWYDGLAVTEIGDLLTGKAQVSRTAEDITVFDMTGLALQDLTVARMLQRRATEGWHHAHPLALVRGRPACDPIQRRAPGAAGYPADAVPAPR